MDGSSQEPISFIENCLDEEVLVKLKGDREFRGKLHAFDQHLNMVLGETTETQTVVEINSSTLKKETKVD